MTERRSKSQTLRPWLHGNRTQSVLRRFPLLSQRVLLQDFTGVPLEGSWRCAQPWPEWEGLRNHRTARSCKPCNRPLVQVDFANQADAFKLNLEMEFKRNRSRYEFLKWCMESFKSFNGTGDRNLPSGQSEYLAQGVLEKSGVYYPDTLVGTDSHTTMINGLGVSVWELEELRLKRMLGQPVYFSLPTW